MTCNQLEPYYGKHYTMARYSHSIWDEANHQLVNYIPEECVAVRLIPQCAVLEDLPEGSMG